jgi:hypothetical protein
MRWRVGAEFISALGKGGGKLHPYARSFFAVLMNSEALKNDLAIWSIKL